MYIQSLKIMTDSLLFHYVRPIDHMSILKTTHCLRVLLLRNIQRYSLILFWKVTRTYKMAVYQQSSLNMDAKLVE